MAEQSFLSKRDREKFAHDGYMFNIERLDVKKRVKFWRCDKRCAYDCRARLHTSMETGEVIKLVNDHNHGSDAVAVEFAAIRGALKKRADETCDPPAVIVKEVCQSVSPDLRAHLPNSAAMREIIRRRRRPTPSVQPQPADLASVVIPEAYQMYSDEDQFLLFDSGQGDQNRIILFGRQSYGAWADSIKNIVADGAFKMAPPPFSQVYVIMAESNGYVLPMLYALLPNKEEQTYCRLFEVIKELWPKFAPETIAVDFEDAAVNAIKANFPSAQLCGCFFFLVRSLKKNLSEQGLLPRYNNDCEFALSARMIASLAFVPVESVDSVFEDLLRELPDELIPTLDWFEETFVGLPTQFGGRRLPRYPPSMWSVYHRTLYDGDQTTTFVEELHRQMRSLFGTDDPSIWNFIDGIRKIQLMMDLNYKCYTAGEEPPKKRTKRARTSNRILQIMRHFGKQPNADYLRGIAICFLLN
ncbi:hypothetical protein M513_03781 [Trichuris suis]|uniref:MULE transposase domain-containing protein n=1 Tax=Trichuris suis TaxID=68888 RepID=A0A085MDZ5_9BILA|nr:hypothetical protein M513_03781 [Trichuris suis]